MPLISSSLSLFFSFPPVCYTPLSSFILCLSISFFSSAYLSIPSFTLISSFCVLSVSMPLAYFLVSFFHSSLLASPISLFSTSSLFHFLISDSCFVSPCFLLCRLQFLHHFLHVSLLLYLLFSSMNSSHCFCLLFSSFLPFLLHTFSCLLTFSFFITRAFIFYYSFSICLLIPLMSLFSSRFVAPSPLCSPPLFPFFL